MYTNSRFNTGDIDTLTVREYLALPRWRQVGYWLYRNPIVMFGLGPAYLFLVQHRLPPFKAIRSSLRSWLSTMATNVAILLIVLAMIWLVGFKPFLVVHAPITLLAASIGVWLFYVQHQFEHTFWAEAPAWTLHEAAKLQSRHVNWPQPYLSGRDQLYREISKQKELAAQADQALAAIK